MNTKPNCPCGVSVPHAHPSGNLKDVRIIEEPKESKKPKSFDEWVHRGRGEDLWDVICARCGFDDDGKELQELIKHFVEEARKWKT